MKNLKAKGKTKIVTITRVILSHLWHICDNRGRDFTVLSH